MRGPVSATWRSRRGADESGDVKYGAWLFVGVPPLPDHDHSLFAALTTCGCRDPHGAISDRSYRSFSRTVASLDVGESTRDGVSGSAPSCATPCRDGDRDSGAMFKASIPGDADEPAADVDSVVWLPAAAAPPLVLPLSAGDRSGCEPSAAPQQSTNQGVCGGERACCEPAAPLLPLDATERVTDDDATLGPDDVACGRPFLSLWWRSAASACGTPADADADDDSSAG